MHARSRLRAPALDPQARMITAMAGSQYFNPTRHIANHLAGRQASADFVSIAPGAIASWSAPRTQLRAPFSLTLTLQRSRRRPVDGSGGGLGSLHRAVLASPMGPGRCRCLASVFEVSRCQAIENKAQLMISDTLDTLDTMAAHMCMRARACTSFHVSKVSYVSNLKQAVDFIAKIGRHRARHGQDTGETIKIIAVAA